MNSLPSPHMRFTSILSYADITELLTGWWTHLYHEGWRNDPQLPEAAMVTPELQLILKGMHSKLIICNKQLWFGKWMWYHFYYLLTVMLLLFLWNNKRKGWVRDSRNVSHCVSDSFDKLSGGNIFITSFDREAICQQQTLHDQKKCWCCSLLAPDPGGGFWGGAGLAFQTSGARIPQYTDK